MSSTAASRAKQKYNNKNYVHVHLQVKPDLKDTWKAAADAAGQSLSSYITEAISQRMSNDAQK